MEGKPNKNMLAERVVAVDLLVVSPKERAAYIHGVLKEHAPNATVWDQICAFGELLGAFSLSEPALEDVVRPLLKRIYTIHYLHGRDLESCLKSNSTPSVLDSINVQALKLMEPIDPTL